MAIINVDDAYILNETGAQVDKTTGIPFKNESLTEAEAAQARANIRAGGSNRNLLDNWYFVGGGSQLGDGVFPINQRGQASYSGSGNIFDRWTLQNAFATLAADAVYFGSTTQNVWGLMQQVPSRYNALWGKTVTVSAFIGGELVQETYTVPQSGAFDMPAAGTGGVFVNLYSYDGSNIVFRIYTQYTAQYHIQAAKLELGTVSTLANDPPPDFGEELRKCQRYFVRLKGTNYWVLNGFASATNYADFSMPLGLHPFAKTPTITTSGTHTVRNGTTNYTVSSMAAQVNTDNILTGIRMTVSSSTMTAYTLAVYGSDGNSYIDLSAEL